MAAPTVTWYPVTNNGGSPLKGSSITELDFGNVQAGYWSAAKAVVATFVGNSANTLKFWLNDIAAEGGNVNVGAGNSWKHTYTIDDNWENPGGITDAMKNGDTGDSNGNTWGVLPETEPGTSNFVNSTVNAGADTNYIYLALRPPSNAGDGITNNWGYRLSFLYP